MQAVVGYHRPESLEEALVLLNRGSPRSLVLAGGTSVNAEESSDPVEMVDLQSIGLDGMRSAGTGLEIGSMVRLTDFLTHEAVPEVLKDVAGREGPNTFRNMGTIGGAVAAGSPDSELLAGFLAYAARVTLAGAGGVTEMIDLEELLGDPVLLEGSIITMITIETEGQAAVARTGRTPADTSIVAVVGRSTPAGLRLGLTGVAGTPVLIDAEQVDALEPPGDFRGSSDYRHHVARTLTLRVLEELGEQS